LNLLHFERITDSVVKIQSLNNLGNGDHSTGGVECEGALTKVKRLLFNVDELSNLIKTAGSALGERPSITEIFANGIPTLLAAGSTLCAASTGGTSSVS
jgi:hypothetical protein